MARPMILPGSMTGHFLPGKLGPYRLSPKNERVEYCRVCRPPFERPAGQRREEYRSVRVSESELVGWSYQTGAERSVLQVNRELLPIGLVDHLSSVAPKYGADLNCVSSLVVTPGLCWERRTDEAREIAGNKRAWMGITGGFEPFMTGLTTSQLAEYRDLFNAHSTIFWGKFDCFDLGIFAYLIGRVKTNVLLAARRIKVEDMAEEIRHALASLYSAGFAQVYSQQSGQSELGAEASRESAGATQSLLMLSQMHPAAAPLIWELEKQL